jgi:hypothetical protein
VPATAITVVALAALLFHLAFPEVSLDSASIALLILAAVPWLGAWIKSIEVAGMKVEFNDLREQLSQVREKVTEGFQTQARQQESVIARVARIESLLEFSGLPVSDERQERITDLVRTFLAYMRGRGAQFGAEPSVRVVPGTEFGQSVHYDPSTNELVVGHAMVDEDDFILRECCFRVFHEPLTDADVKRAVGDLAMSGPGLEAGSLIAGLGFYFVCSFNERPRFSGQGQRILDLERPELSMWAPALVLRPADRQAERDRLSYVTALGDRWAHVLWGARVLVGREAMDELILETWNELNSEGAFRLGHAEFRAGLSRRLARRHAEAARTLDQLADKLLGQTPS